jgi:hypothetical protein
MQMNLEFQAQLSVAYEAKLADIERTHIARFKENLQNFLSSYHSLYELLIGKGLVKGDPYKNERHLSDIAPLDDAFMTEAEYEQMLPIRLSEFDNMLDFLINYTAFSVVQLSLKRLKIILSIIKFINWSSLSVTSNQATTRALASLLDKFRLGNDSVAVSAMQVNHDSLDKTFRQIQKDLKDLADFKKDEYKFLIRQNLLTKVNISGVLNKEDFIRVVKAGFPKFWPGEAFFPELVGELYDELVNEKSDAIREAVLRRFYVEIQRVKTETKKIDLLSILLEGLRQVGTSSRHLEESVRKLTENCEILKTQPKTLWEKFQAWIISLSGPKQKETIISVEIVDLSTTATHVEAIAFETFCNNINKRSRQFTALAIKSSALYQRFESGKEADTYDFLKKCHGELRVMHERLEALDLYFKTEAPAEERNKLRGIKTELVAIKNAITTVNQKLHEYLARREEIEQLRKLGIEQ